MSRYENGALQSDSHNSLLQLAMDPANLLKLIYKRERILPPETFKLLVAKVHDSLREENPPYMRLMASIVSQYEPDEFSGYLALNLEKFLDVVLFLCTNEDVFKTKLNKLLFYSDFKHFKEYSVSITGARYAHLPCGPAPDHYDMFLTMFQEGKRITLVEKAQQEYVGDIVVAQGEPQISNFSSSEIKILAMIKERFEGHSSNQISELSHREAAYSETKDGDLISYSYAESLSI